MTAAELRKAELRYQAAARRAEVARAQRNAAIATALAGGMTHTEIAKATGLTRGRVGQLAALGIASTETEAGAPE